MNPFSRLRHYRVEGKLTDARENHATECLASILHFSLPIRERFLRLMFGDGAALNAGELSVTTQLGAGEFGIPDLFLSDDDDCHLAIEVKVDAREST